MKQEIIENRNLTSKEVINDDGSHTISLHRQPIHYTKDGKFEDINLTLVETATGFEMMKANYNLIITDNDTETKIKFSKEGHWIEFTPNELRWTNDEGDVSTISKFKRTVPIVTNNEITWPNAFGHGIDLMYGCGYAGIYKKVILQDFIDAPTYIKEANNPRMEISLKYTKSSILTKVDKRTEDFKTAQKLHLEKVEFGSLWEFTLPRFGDSGRIHPTATGEDIGERTISETEICTSTPYSWLVKAIYPAFIDTDINEQIGASSDDCVEVVGQHFNSSNSQITFGRLYVYPLGYYDYDVGLRWQTVNIPKNVNIQSATLSLYMTSDNGSLESTIKGIAEDDTPTWSSGNRPSDRSKTSTTVQANKTDWGNWGTYQWITRDITGIIEEIIIRDGWSPNNDLAIAIENDNADSAINCMEIRTWDFSGNAHGSKLDITYTDFIPTIIIS